MSLLSLTKDDYDDLLRSFPEMNDTIISHLLSSFGLTKNGRVRHPPPPTHTHHTITQYIHIPSQSLENTPTDNTMAAS